MAKAPKPNLLVKFTGGRIAPELIPVHAMGRAVSAVQRLAAGASVDVEEEDDTDPRNPLSLLKVRRGSAEFLCAAQDPATARQNLRMVGQGVENPAHRENVAFALRPLETLSALARKYNCQVVVADADGKGVLARIGPGTYEEVSRTLVLEGDTTLIGQVERAGGATEERCALRVPRRHRLLYCSVDGPNLVEQLGEKLYQQVAVSGTAKWIRSTWYILAFTVKKVSQPRLGKAADLVKRIRAAGGDGWDRFEDPAAYLEGITEG